MVSSRVSAGALLTASALFLTACASGGGATDAGDGRIDIVASTSAYGQLAEEIGGDAVTVTSIITSASQDPHSFEASASDQLAVSRADLLIENGGGYDAFMTSLLEASGTEAPVVTAVDYAGDQAETEASDDDHGHIEGFNEHVWYDPHTVVHVVEAIADELSDLRPADAATFDASAADLVAQLEGLEASLDEIATTHSGERVFVTEPVPLYLTAAAGLVNATPEAFSEAVEEGQDVPPTTLLEALDELRSGEVRVVIANSQTGGAETTQVLDEAESRGIPVIEFSETLPTDETYVRWMQDNIDALAAALDR